VPFSTELCIDHVGVTRGEWVRVLVRVDNAGRNSTIKTSSTHIKTSTLHAVVHLTRERRWSSTNITEPLAMRMVDCLWVGDYCEGMYVISRTLPDAVVICVVISIVANIAGVHIVHVVRVYIVKVACVVTWVDAVQYLSWSAYMRGSNGRCGEGGRSGCRRFDERDIHRFQLINDIL